MGAYYFDTSALVKRYVLETGSEWVRGITQAGMLHSVYICRITPVELYSAVTRRQKGGGLKATEASVILALFRRNMLHRFHVLEVDSKSLTDALFYVRKYGLKAYDAIQLAMAFELDRLHKEAGLGSVTLVSADEELNEAAQDSGLTVENPNHL